MLTEDNKRLKRVQQQEEAILRETGFAARTLWDWLQLLIVPLLLTLGGLWFTAQQNLTSFQLSDRQHKFDVQRDQDQQQEATLQEYLDRMSDLLLNYKLYESKEGDEVRQIAIARTLTTLQRLADPKRKDSLLQFLYEANLIKVNNQIISLSGANLSGADLSGAHLSSADLSGANLSGADLSGAYLSGADLSDANLNGAKLSITYLDSANLRNADLSGADLSGAGLSGANLNGTNLKRDNLSGDILSGASLSGANLNGANLRNTDLSGAYLVATYLQGADLSSANLSGAHLKGADLSDAILDRTDLSGADLSYATVTQQQLAQAKSLQGARMPDGSIHP